MKEFNSSTGKLFESQRNSTFSKIQA